MTQISLLLAQAMVVWTSLHLAQSKSMDTSRAPFSYIVMKDHSKVS